MYPSAAPMPAARRPLGEQNDARAEQHRKQEAHLALEQDLIDDPVIVAPSGCSRPGAGVAVGSPGNAKVLDIHQQDAQKCEAAKDVYLVDAFVCLDRTGEGLRHRGFRIFRISPYRDFFRRCLLRRVQPKSFGFHVMMLVSFTVDRIQTIFIWMMFLLAANTGVLLTLLRERIAFRRMRDEVAAGLPAGYDPKRIDYPYLFSFLTPPAWAAALAAHEARFPEHPARQAWRRFHSLRTALMIGEFAAVLVFIAWVLLS